jgi:hypothetical protein
MSATGFTLIADGISTSNPKRCSMSRKLFAATLFAVACVATLYASSTADAIDEAPAPRPVVGGGEEKKPDAKGKFGGFGGKFGKGGFGGGKFDPAKFKDMKGKFGGKGGFGKKKDDDKKE